MRDSKSFQRLNSVERISSSVHVETLLFLYINHIVLTILAMLVAHIFSPTAKMEEMG